MADIRRSPDRNHCNHQLFMVFFLIFQNDKFRHLFLLQNHKIFFKNRISLQIKLKEEEWVGNTCGLSTVMDAITISIDFKWPKKGSVEIVLKDLECKLKTSHLI